MVFTLNCISSGFKAEARTIHNEHVRANAKGRGLRGPVAAQIEAITQLISVHS